MSLNLATLWKKVSSLSPCHPYQRKSPGGNSSCVEVTSKDSRIFACVNCAKPPENTSTRDHGKGHELLGEEFPWEKGHELSAVPIHTI
jgi:hypothetical protein